MAYGSINVLGGGGGSTIKSVQSGKVQQAQGSTTTNVAIQSVTPANCVVLVEPVGDTVTSATMALGTFPNNTTLRLQRTDPDYSIYTFYKVIEFENLKSMQKLSTTIKRHDLTKTVNISTVNPNKTLVFLNWRTEITGNATNSATDGFSNYQLTANQITITLGRNSFGKIFDIYVVEFN